MLEKCEREQWDVRDLDWSGTPRPMSRDDEIAICQYFTDMAGIERLAGALFNEQRKKVEDPTLRKIFATFVKDEVRHSHAAQMLADYYDVHHYRVYQMSPALVRFTPHFVNMVQFLSPEIANAYITGGELILDIALLRSINDHVGDEMSERAMALINRDESRHIAIDFHMVGVYTSKEYWDSKANEPTPPLAQRARAARAFAGVLYNAAPFFRDVFFEPMQVVDPSGKRLREAFKRIQLLGQKPYVRTSPFVRVMTGLQDAYNDHAVVRTWFGPAIERAIGIRGELMERLYDESELRRAERMSLDDMAKEALDAKYVN